MDLFSNKQLVKKIIIIRLSSVCLNPHDKGALEEYTPSIILSDILTKFLIIMNTGKLALKDHST